VNCETLKIFVKYFALIKDITKKKCDELDVGKEETMQRIISKLCDMYGDNFKQTIIREEGKLNEGFMILLNGEAIDQKELKTKLLFENDVLAIIPPIGGG